MLKYLTAGLLAVGTSAAVFKGTATSDVGFAFLGKFAFNTGEPGGTIDLTLTEGSKDEDYKDYEIWLFDDEKDSWPLVYGKTEDCKEARKVIKNQNTAGVINADSKVQFNSEGKFTLSTSINQGARRRFWFVVAAHCPSTGGQKIEPLDFEVHMLQSNIGKWDREFGANQVGLQSMYVAAFFFFIPFFIIHFYGTCQLRKKLEYTHPMIRLFALIVFIELLVIGARLVHWGAFVHNGMGVTGALPASDFLELISRTLFVLMLILLAKGWTISGDELAGKKIIFAIVGSFFLFAALIIVWDLAAYDPAASKVDIAVQIFVYIVNAIWVGFAVWFTYTVFSSYSAEDNPVKKSLYLRLGLVYAPWFFGLPLTSFLTVILEPWVREKIVGIVGTLFTMFSLFVMSFLLWPSRAEDYFSISTPDVMKAQIDTYEQL